jgi:hypothetical protein
LIQIIWGQFWNSEGVNPSEIANKLGIDRRGISGVERECRFSWIVTFGMRRHREDARRRYLAATKTHG